MPLRISTFNCENLLSRAKVLNFDKNNDAREPLNNVAKLDAILSKDKYSEADKQSILELLDALKDYVDLNEMKAKLVSKHKVDGRMQEYVKANGRADWVGGLSLKRDELPTDAQVNTAKVIQAVGADIQCVVEVEDRPTLETFNDGPLKRAFGYNLVIDGNDQRGIDVGVLSKVPFGRIRTHVFDPDGAPRTKRVFSRDCLELEVVLSGAKSMFLLVNHFKSQGYGPKDSNDARRKRQADRVVEILGSYDLSNDLVVVAGDFNDKPDSAPLASLLGIAGLTDALKKQFPDPKDRWTYKDKKQIDYLLVSAPLAEAMTKAGVERRGMFQADKLTGGAVMPFDTVTSDTNDASDHAAVWAEFDL